MLLSTLTWCVISLYFTETAFNCRGWDEVQELGGEKGFLGGILLRFFFMDYRKTWEIDQVSKWEL